MDQDTFNRIKGLRAEAKVVLRATEKGYIVSVPRGTPRYDLVIDTGTQLYRAQVKYAAGKSSNAKGVVVLGLRKTYKNKTLKYLSTEIDMLLVYLPEIDEVLCFHQEQFHDKNNLHIRLHPPLKDVARGKYLFAKDFIW